MVIKERYKQTEIGLIPNDWEVKTLGDIAFVLGGGTPSTNINSYWNGDINWFTPTEIGSKKYSHESIRKLTKLGFENSSAKILPVGTILLTSRAGIGDISMLMNEGCTNQGFQSLVPKKDVYNEFLYYLVATLKSTLIQNASGSTFLEISPNKVKSIEIALPSLVEQTSIATALSDADGLITGLEKLITKKRNIKQGAMQQLLQPKEGWEVKKIIELSENKKELFDDGDWVESEHIINEGVRLIQTGNIGIGKYLEKGSKKYISENSFLELKCKPLIKGDILICRLADPAGRACIFPDINEQKVITSVDVTIFRPKNELVNRNFLLYTFSTSKWFQQIIEKVGGTTHKRISRSSLGNIKISLPALEEQIRIASILTDMDAELLALEQKLEKYKKVKLGMMQELLTGKTRLV